ncbi:MAG: LysR family transcriptional regulator [Thalassospira sp. Nap_22]|nr:MAG: LysR family transcriptional regulator [Thalassospira sp. Nap_22]
MSLDWEGLRTFAVVCQAGNMSAAARELGINQTTVARRIARLEEWVGYSVLHRDGRAVAPTTRAQSLLKTALQMQETVSGLLVGDPQTDQYTNQISGIVRLTGVDAILQDCVAPHMASLHRQYPGIALELIGANRNLSLPQRETDIAIRLARPETGAFHIRRLGCLEYGVFCNPNGLPLEVLDPTKLPWIDLDEFFADKPEQKWLSDHFPDRKTIGYANRGSIMVSMMAGHACCALLPVCVGARIDGLTLLDGYDPVGREVWLLTHQDKRHLPPVRAVADWLVNILLDGEFISRP